MLICGAARVVQVESGVGWAEVDFPAAELSQVLVPLMVTATGLVVGVQVDGAIWGHLTLQYVTSFISSAVVQGVDCPAQSASGSIPAVIRASLFSCGAGEVKPVPVRRVRHVQEERIASRSTRPDFTETGSSVRHSSTDKNRQQ